MYKQTVPSQVGKDLQSLSLLKQSVIHLLNQNKPHKALQYLRQIDSAAFSGDAQLLLLLGIVQKQTGECQQALQTLAQALQLQPDNPLIYYNLGNIYRSVQKYSESIHFYFKCIKHDCKIADAWRNMGLSFSSIHDPTLALWCHTQELKLRPHNPSSRFQHALVLYQNKFHSDSIERLKKLVKDEPSFMQAWFNLALFQQDQGQITDAIASFQEAINLNPHYSKSYSALGQAYREAGLYDQAINSFDQAIKINPRDVEAYRRKAYCINFYPGHPFIISLERALADQANSRTDIMQLAYALGHAYE